MCGARGRLGGELDGCSDGDGLDVLAGGHGERGEGLDGEVGAFGAGFDEGCCEGEDGAGADGRVEGLRDGDLLGEDADGGLVTSLDGEDRARGTQDRSVGEERCRAEIGRDADVFENGGRGDHAGCVGEAKIVRTRLDGLDARLRERGLEETDVGGLGLADLLEVGDGEGVEAEGGKVGVGELGKALAVEGLFEVLKSQGAGLFMLVMDE